MSITKFEVLCPSLQRSDDPEERLRPFAIVVPAGTFLFGRAPLKWQCSACGAVLPDSNHTVYVRQPLCADPKSPAHPTE